jgi:hypothetical protein
MRSASVYTLYGRGKQIIIRRVYTNLSFNVCVNSVKGLNKDCTTLQVIQVVGLPGWLCYAWLCYAKQASRAGPGYAGKPGQATQASRAPPGQAMLRRLAWLSCMEHFNYIPSWYYILKCHCNDKTSECVQFISAWTWTQTQYIIMIN